MTENECPSTRSKVLLEILVDKFKRDGPSDDNVVSPNTLDKQISEIMNAGEKGMHKK